MTLTLIIWVVTFAINYLICCKMVRNMVKEDNDTPLSDVALQYVFYIFMFIFSPLMFVLGIAYIIHETLQDGLNKIYALARLRRMKRKSINQ